MINCRDCIHHNVCYYAGRWKTKDSDGEKRIIAETNNVEDTCESFQDRSAWVKLPCKLNLPKELYRYMFDNDYKKIVVKCKVCNVTAHGFTLMHYLDGRKWNYTYDRIGKTVFLSREEAKRALKERESNDK